MQTASRSPGYSSLWLATLTVLLSASAHAQDNFDSSPGLSPDGKWLVDTVNALRGTRGPAGGGRSHDPIGQWIFRIKLDEEKPGPQLLHREAGTRLKRLEHRFTSAVILDDGVVLAFKDTGDILRWEPSGDRETLKLFDTKSLFLKVHLRPDGKELLVFRQFLSGPASEETRQEVYYLDIASNKAELRNALRDIADHEIHWTPDLKRLIAAESTNANSGKSAGKKRGEGVESYRLVRVDLETGDREVISPSAWFYGNCVGRKWIAWNHKEGSRRGIFWKVQTAGPYEPVEIPSLKDWTPIAAIDDERFLCRSLDWKRHAVADFSPPPEGAEKQGPAISEIKIPKCLSDRNLFWSPAIEAIILCPRAFTWELRALDGNLLRTVKLDPRARLSSRE